MDVDAFPEDIRWATRLAMAMTAGYMGWAETRDPEPLEAMLTAAVNETMATANPHQRLGTLVFVFARALHSLVATLAHIQSVTEEEIMSSLALTLERLDEGRTGEGDG